jgi:hypothetical protein
MDDFSIKAGDNKYKHEVLTEIYRRRDLAFRYSCFFCFGMLLYLSIMGILQFIFFLAGRNPGLPPFGTSTLLVAPLVFIPAIVSLFMKPQGIVITIVVFLIFSAIYFLRGYYIFLPFTLAGAFVYLQQSAVCDAYACISKLDGFPEFSDFTFEHKKEETD